MTLICFVLRLVCAVKFDKVLNIFCGVSWKTLTLILWFFEEQYSFKSITIQSARIITFFLGFLFLSALLLWIVCDESVFFMFFLCIFPEICFTIFAFSLYYKGCCPKVFLIIICYTVLVTKKSSCFQAIFFLINRVSVQVSSSQLRLRLSLLFIFTSESSCFFKFSFWQTNLEVAKISE